MRRREFLATVGVGAGALAATTAALAMPLLKNPAAKWDKPVLTTYLKGNHSIRDERFRYIRYNDGGEELYDHSNDPNEWTSLADRQEFANIKSRLAKWLPKTDAPDSPTGKGLGLENPEDA